MKPFHDRDRALGSDHLTTTERVMIGLALAAAAVTIVGIGMRAIG